MAAIKGYPPYRITRLAPRVVCRNVGSATWRGFLGTDPSAAVVCDKFIAHGTTSGDVECAVTDAVDTEVRDRVGAAATAAKLAAGDNSDGAEVLGARAGDGEGHGTAVGETDSEALALVDAEVVLDGLPHGVDERDVLAAGVAPAVVQALRRDENGAFVRHPLLPVVGPQGTVAAPARDVVHGSADPVKGEDEPVRLASVVPARYADNILPGLAIDGDRLGSRRQSWCLAAARRVGCHCMDWGVETRVCSVCIVLWLVVWVPKHDCRAQEQRSDERR
jgi:hypothetical protein